MEEYNSGDASSTSEYALSKLNTAATRRQQLLGTSKSLGILCEFDLVLAFGKKKLAAEAAQETTTFFDELCSVLDEVIIPEQEAEDRLTSLQATLDQFRGNLNAFPFVQSPVLLRCALNKPPQHS